MKQESNNNDVDFNLLNENYYNNDNNKSVVKTNNDDNDNERFITLRKVMSRDSNNKKDVFKE